MRHKSNLKRDDRLAYMKRRFPILRELTDVVLPVTNDDIRDEMTLMDSVRENARDAHTSEELTSDATS
jgi:hypothetical protein